MLENTNSTGISGGYCKWYEIENKGKQEKVQGTWELLFANYLIECSTEFVAHPPSVFYKDEKGIQRRYFPDFLIIETGQYLDVKNPFCLKRDEVKIKCLNKTGINLTIITKESLTDLGLL